MTGIEITAEDYVTDVLTGKINTCRWVQLACERHRRDLEHGHKRGLYFDEKAAKLVIAFFSILRHWKGEWAGKPIHLEPCQQFWLWSLFGWKRKADGSRRFRTAYLEVARKNTKTTIAAGIGLYLGFLDGEPGAEVYSAATRRDQAKICHTDATNMVKRSPQLRQEVAIFRDNLHNEQSGSKFEPVSSDYNTLDGLNIHGAIADELHAWKKMDLWGVLRTATGARRQPLMLAITTAGLDQQGVCYTQREYVTRILKELIEDDAYFGIIYTLDTKRDWPDLETDDTDTWQDQDNWIKANPMINVSKKMETMENDARQAAGKPTELNQFLRYHLNVWTQALTRWVNPIHWAACGELPIYEDELEGRPAYAALDCSSVYDLSAFMLLIPPDEIIPADYDPKTDPPPEPYRLICRFWLPEDNMIDRVNRDQVPYDVWAGLGLITLTPGNVIDYDFIEAEVLDLALRYDIIELGYDRWGASQIMQHFQQVKGDDWVVPIGQGFVSMSPPMKELGRMIASGRLAHGNNQVLNWMADNLVAREDPAGNIKPDKEKSREKIDGMVALIMSVDRATRGVSGSVYETRGLTIV